MHGDDAFLIFVRYAPLAFVVGGVVTVMWLARQRLPHELEPDVLAALSDTEALPTNTIRQRPPLAYQNVDMRMLEHVLDTLCAQKRVVRWYEPPTSRETLVYRRVKSDDEGGVR